MIIVMATIVSMASVAMGLQAFAEGQRKANADAMLDDALSIVADVQAWRLQPTAMGGGQGSHCLRTRITHTGDDTPAEASDVSSCNGI